MKKSNTVTLVLISAALASCNQHTEPTATDWEYGNKHVYMRSDTSAAYSPTYHYNHWYRAFRPYGAYYGGNYYRYGYYSNIISQRANLGSNSYKSYIVRGGFGTGHLSVSS